MFGKISHYNHTKLQQHKSLCHHHCGLCKTLGKDYGLLSRFVVNQDVALLQEMLGAIDNTISGNNTKDFRSYNCFKYPSDPAPISFKYTAAISLLMTQFKIEDNIDDNRGYKKIVFKLLKLLFKNKYKKAVDYLESVNFPLSKVVTLIEMAKKKERELSIKNENSLDKLSLEYGEVTGVVAEHGVYILKNPQLMQDAYKFGNAFGRLIHISDAYLDLYKDLNNSRYNPLVEIFRVRETKEMTKHQINTLEVFINDNLHALEGLNEQHIDSNITHLVRRIRYNIDLIFSVNPTNYAPGFIKKNKIKWHSFICQVGFHTNQLIISNKKPLGLFLRKISIISFCMFSVFILGCYQYQSDVPLSNRIDFGSSIDGKWKECDEKEGEFIEIEKLNKTDYLWTTHSSDGNQFSEIIFFSEVSGISFINIKMDKKKGEKQKYVIGKIKVKGDKFFITFVGNYLFEKGDLQFDDPGKLTAYVKRIMNSKYFYKSWDKEEKKFVTNIVMEKCRVK